MNNALKTTIKRLTPAVLLSLVATSLGLLSLFQSKVPMIQDFGLMLTIGIAVAFVFAVLLLLPILTVHTSINGKKKIKKEHKETWFTKAMKQAVSFIVKAKYPVVIIAVLLAGLGFYLDQGVESETDMETFMPQDSEALSDINELRGLIGSTDRIVVLYEDPSISSYETLASVQAITTLINTSYQEYIISTNSMTTMLDMVSNGSWNETNVDTYLASIPDAQQRLVQSKEDNLGIINISLEPMDAETFDTFITNLQVDINALNLSIDEITITGQSVVDAEMLDAMTSDRLYITLLGVGLVFLVLLVFYRNVFKALIAILPIVLIIGWSGGLMYLFGFEYTPLTSTLGALIIGIGIEFTILILMRYYELQKIEGAREDNIVNAISLMSKPIIVSAVTTIGGFSALILSDFQILSNFGIMTLVNISLALISALFVLPAILAVIGKHTKSLT